MRVRALLLALCLLLCGELSAVSKGSVGNKDDPWNPHHISDLPVDIQRYIAGICRGPASAQHDFATYSPHERRWRINLEYLRCNGLGEYRRGNQCLDVDFVEAGSRFRLASKQYRDCGFSNRRCVDCWRFRWAALVRDRSEARSWLSSCNLTSFRFRGQQRHCSGLCTISLKALN